MKPQQDHAQQDYILVIGQPSKELAAAKAIAQTLNCSVVSISSPRQAIAKAQANPPYLVILSGDDRQTWSPQTARQIKQSLPSEGIVIVALTESSEPSWTSHPNSAEIDGFFVAPISVDVLSSLHDAAIAKKQCLQFAHL
ncbi:MAG: hypothetical protein AAGM27_06455 [Cyanobacteria bacterium J06554_3]